MKAVLMKKLTVVIFAQLCRRRRHFLIVLKMLPMWSCLPKKQQHNIINQHNHMLQHNTSQNLELYVKTRGLHELDFPSKQLS